MTNTVDMALAEIAGAKLWGASEIAAFLGVSCDHVYDLAGDPDVPIYKPPGAGRYFAYRAELARWLRTKPPSFPDLS